MIWLHLVLLVLACVLALSSLIVTKRPDAKAAIAKLVPFQAFIGLALLASAMWMWLRSGLATPFRMLGKAPLFGATMLGVIATALLLGFFFGMPQIAKWIPGESKAETAALDASKKLAPIQMVVGIIGLGAALLAVLYSIGVLRVR